MKSVGVIEAKSELSRLLEEVQGGSRITITDNGKPIAKLVPINEDEQTSVEEFLERAQNLRKSIGEGLDIRAMVTDGRRH